MDPVLSVSYEIFYETAYRRTSRGPWPPKEEALPKPEHARCLQDWGWSDDTAVPPVEIHKGGRLGATWRHLMTFKEPGYGFVDDQTPRFALAVVSDHRGYGMGGALLGELRLREAARSQGYSALSVEKGNPALGLYERNGFVTLLETEDAWTMGASFFAGGA